jgi:hypothetical protein
MSEQNPYGGSGEPPGNYPTYPPGHPQGQPPRRDRWKIWMGIGLAIPALIATGVLAGMVGVVDDSGALSSLFVIAGLLAPVVLLFFPSTRKVAIGLLIGYGTLFILAAGACVALIASYDNLSG